MTSFRTFATLVLFHLQSGTRVALRTVVPLAGGIVAAGVLAGSPLIVLAPFTYLLFPSGPSAGSALVSVGLFGMVHLWLAPRLTRGLTGWVRHLPASGIVHRRAVTLGLQGGSFPIFLFIAAAGIVSIPLHPSASLLRLAALPLVFWASALGALPVKPWTRVLAAAAGALSFFGSPPTFLAGLGALVVSDLAAGPLRDRTSRGRRNRDALNSSNWRLYWLRITARALGLRCLTGPASATLVLLPLVLFLCNNELSALQESVAVRFAAMAGAMVAIGVAGDVLVVRRPPWPWIRSLPFSSATRVTFDAALLVTAALPALIVAGFLDDRAALGLIGLMPFVTLRAVSAVRTAPGKTSSASGQIALEGSLASISFAVWPWTSLILAFLTPVAFRTAVNNDRDQEVSRWHELHHLASGDSMSWSGR